MIAEQSQWISFQGLVDHKDSLLADRSAAGLAELFAGRFAETREEMARPSAAQRSGSSFAVTNARWLSEPIVTSSPVIEVREPLYETAPRADRPGSERKQAPILMVCEARTAWVGLASGNRASRLDRGGNLEFRADPICAGSFVSPGDARCGRSPVGPWTYLVRGCAVTNCFLRRCNAGYSDLGH
jgi:hypothetical protein